MSASAFKSAAATPLELLQASVQGARKAMNERGVKMAYIKMALGQAATVLRDFETGPHAETVLKLTNAPYFCDRHVTTAQLDQRVLEAHDKGYRTSSDVGNLSDLFLEFAEHRAENLKKGRGEPERRAQSLCIIIGDLANAYQMVSREIEAATGILPAVHARNRLTNGG